MPSCLNTAILTALAAAVSVSAHGFVESVVINGVGYEGYSVYKHEYLGYEPTVVGWTNSANDSGFVGPESYDHPDIICHRDATNGKGHARVAAGDSVWLQWGSWPDSHHGPVLDYLAACGEAGCETVDKTDLEFFKIDEGGLIDGSTTPGYYYADELIANGNGWLVQIPKNIKPGFYVLRHEIIALHLSYLEDGAQNYPQCINLEITGTGTEEPAGVPGMELYKSDDAGIFVNIQRAMQSYEIPGPPVIQGAGIVDQVSSKATTTALATTGTELSPAPTSDSSPEVPEVPETPEVTPGPAVPEDDEEDVVFPPMQPSPTRTLEITPGETEAVEQPEAPDVETPQTPSVPLDCKNNFGKKCRKLKAMKQAKEAAKAKQSTIPRC